MASLADKAILSGADNRPSMPEKDMYDSWKSRMELYMLNRTHGMMILESVEQGTDTSSLVNHNAYMASSSALEIAYAPMDQHSSEYSPPEAGIVILVFQKGDDPIDAINHMMSFLTSVVASRYPATNNQLQTSSNPRQQATINNGRVTIQPIQGRQNFVSAGSSRPFTSGQAGAQGKQRVITCYNCKGEARVANPLALVAQQQPVYHPQTHHTHYNQNSSTRTQQAATMNRGKAIVNSPQQIYDQEPSMVDDDDETKYGHVARECQKPKLENDAAYYREKMLLCKQEEAGIQLNVEQTDWKDDTDDESDDQELEAHY
nr:hypothetical protein [Tanacetum cinerariifolium]